MLRSIFLLAVLLPPPPVAAQEATLLDRFTRTEAMVPMRDGAKLYTTVFVPRKSDATLPFVYLRTPYGIDTFPQRAFANLLRPMVEEGYIFVFQDIRGRFKSEGQFVMSRPPRDKSDAKAVDESTDTYDTIDWLLQNVKGHNGRVGMLGISYGGWLTVMGMLDPHPALKAASPQASPADMFLGDDFHHNGAFRLSYGFEYVAMMETNKVNFSFQFDRHDTFEWYLRLGALSNVNTRYFKGKLPTWNDFVAHPNYDDFWKKQAFDPYLDKVTVPTLNVAGWFDQEDFYGPLRVYKQLEKHDRKSQNSLVVGPWNHGGWSSGKGDSLGRIKFASDTGPFYRDKIQAPWFAYHLKDKGKDEHPEAWLFQTGTNRWHKHAQWPPKNAETKKLYFHAGGKLAFTPPTEPGHDAYLSDPANPVPYRPRPVTPTYPGPEWRVWMVEDQRFAHQRPDVITYETEPLKEDVVLAGEVIARLHASTSGTDCDWVVRLIDAYPEKYAEEPAMGGYQLLLIGEPLRARFRKSFSQPEPVVPDEINEYTIGLHWNHHCFRKGHRIMVQVQSTWFPLIDRNPQKYVDNIFQAKDSDFQVARQKVYRSPQAPSHLELTILPK